MINRFKSRVKNFKSEFYKALSISYLKKSFDKISYIKFAREYLNMNIKSILNSKLLTPLNKIWFKFGLFLGSIISPIIMSLIFFLVLTPIGLFMRILGKRDKKVMKQSKSMRLSLRR